jgi:mannose-6-phosphate isomerase-like protein (cupin superfamily)
MDTDVDEAALDAAPELEELLARARTSADALWARARRLHAGPAHRTFTRIHSAPDHDVWVIVWGPGSGIELHDHGGSAGAFAVARGALTDTDEAPDGTRTIRRVYVGEGRRIDPGVRHAVRNDGGTPAVSVHVYSPPLARMRFYDGPDASREEAIDEGRSR